jgi:lipopolysaccharide export system protein LptA
MTQMQQWDDFRFEEGDRKARASRATMDSAANTILLEDAARMWDSTGSTSADRIQLDQATGNFVAAGHVNSSRLPDQKKKSSEMLSGDEPLQAKAETMRSENRNRLLHYEGQAILWQGANRIRADRVEIDREKRTLVGDGNVFTQLLEQNSEKQEAAKNRSNPGGFTTVKAAHMVYTESDRVAHYTGGVLLNRPNLQVKSLRLQAFLAESDADSRIEKAFADGNVEIVQTGANKCVHTGTSEHSEYYAGVEKIILRGGEPQLVDSCQGYTKGAELTYFVNDDRLQVIGAVGQPANSRIRRK